MKYSLLKDVIMSTDRFLDKQASMVPSIWRSANQIVNNSRKVKPRLILDLHTVPISNCVSVLSLYTLQQIDALLSFKYTSLNFQLYPIDVSNSSLLKSLLKEFYYQDFHIHIRSSLEVTKALKTKKLRKFNSLETFIV